MNNANILKVTENRNFVDKAKEKMEQIRKDYKENMIDNGKAQELEERIEKDAELAKKIIRVAGTAATIALIFVPADGPFGEIATLLATPALCNLVDVCVDIRKKALIAGKRGIEKYVLNVDGANEKVKGYNLDNKESFIKDFKNLKEGIDNFNNVRGV